MKEYFSRTSDDGREWEHLEYHLERTAELARDYSNDFSCGNIGYLMGLFHDAGKASEAFQRVLKSEESKINHEATGAFLLQSMHVLPVVIFAHHRGLCDDIRYQLEGMYDGSVEYEERKEQRRFSTLGEKQIQLVTKFYNDSLLMQKISKAMLISAKEKIKSFSSSNNLEYMLFCRMLLSSLVDADYSASAEYNNKNYLDENSGYSLDCELILDNLEKYVSQIRSKSTANTSLNKIRDSLYNQCSSVALCPPGIFTLTAPTGTGKTLAILAFAASHALKYHKKHIIIVLPYLSVISQNTSEYRKIYPNILEVHSNTDSNDTTRELSQRWSDGFIVTTSVQFFEALFKAKPSDLRKLHNFANSVIIFDEAQSLPTELLKPTIETIKLLCEKYNSSFVFSTATQPKYSIITKFASREIVKNIPDMYLHTRRNKIHWDIDSEVPLEGIAERMSELGSVCCIVNLRVKLSIMRLFQKLCKPPKSDIMEKIKLGG